MKRLILITFLIIASSCSSIKDRVHRMEVDVFVKDFEERCDCEVDVPISLKEIDSSDNEDGARTLGVCYGFRMPRFLRRVVIDVNYWDEASYYEKEATMFHELAHCVLDLGHTEEMVGDYIFVRPKSLMYPYSFYHYRLHREEYLKELFERQPKY